MKPRKAFLVVVTVALFVLSCKDSGVNSTEVPGYLQFGTVGLQFPSAPQGITTVIATLTRPGFVTRTLSLSIVDSSASGTFSDVPVGRWHLLVEAFDEDSVVRYRGETDVHVQPGITIVSLQLHPTSGSIQIFVTWGTISSTNLIQNGSFELGPGGGWTYWPLDSGSTAMPGWTVTRGQIDIVRYWQNFDGLRSLDLDGTPGRGGVKQSFATTPGAFYQVQFAMAGNPEGPPSLKTMGVRAGNQSSHYSFSVAGRNIYNMGWEIKTWVFTAVDSVTTLEFYSMDPTIGLYGPALDNVSVRRIQ